MKLVGWKNHLGGRILYVEVSRSLHPSKKRRQTKFEFIFEGVPIRGQSFFWKVRNEVLRIWNLSNFSQSP